MMKPEEPGSVASGSSTRIAGGNGDGTGTGEARGDNSLRLVTFAMMLAMSVAALEQTVVATAMPRIIAALRGGESYPWVFSAYLLMATVSTPIYGKLADLWGRRRLLLFGLGVFLVGSVLSGLSTSMSMLIAMRAVQGLGAGALMPIILTLLGDMYSLEERAKVQGYFSAVWGAASVAGPILGGWLTDQLSWRWVFFIVVPFGLVSVYVIAFHFEEPMAEREVRPIDWQGAVLLASGTSLLLFALLGGSGLSWWLDAALYILAVLAYVGFVFWELRAEDPILPMDLMATPLILASVAGSFLIGALLFGIDAYLPLYIQGTLGRRATDSGMLLMPLFVSWSLSVTVAAKVVVRFGFRLTGVAGTTLIASGMGGIVLGALFPARADILFGIGLMVMGFGMGPTSLSYILAVQNLVPWNRRGVATGAVTFARTMGGVLGVAALGAALNWGLAYRLPGFHDVAAVLRADMSQIVGPEALETIRWTLGHSLRDLFLMMLAAATLGLICAWYLPAGHSDRQSTDPQESEQDGQLSAAAVVD